MEPLNEVSIGGLAWFTGNPISAISEDNSGGLMLARHGLVMTREDVNELYQKAMTFIDHVGDEFIEYENQCAIERKDNRGAAKPKERKPMAGWVYVVQIVGDNLYKIGMTTKKPTERLAQFAPKMPYTAELVYTKQSANPMALEASLHQLYDDLRENGEWFRLSAAYYASLIEYLDDLKE